MDLNVKTNKLLTKFSFSESITLSRLFKSYCTNVYWSPLWRYNNYNNIERFCIAWSKAIRTFEDYGNYRTERTML